MKLSDPYLSRVLYIDLTRKKYWIENRDDIFEEYIGGVGVATKLLQEELPRNADPLGPENVIVFAVGPFNAVYPIASKTVAMFKSPLTRNLGESHAGGRSSTVIRMAGYGAIVIKGASDIPIYLAIHGEKVYFKDARALWGVRSAHTIGRVLREREPGSGYRTIMRIGRAGEELVRYASVIVDSYRHFGRLGLGAVMGSKKLKALVISGKRSIPIPNKPKYREVYNKIYKAAIESPAMRKYHDYGTPVNVLHLNALGALPAKNLTSAKFDGAEEISGERLAETKLARRVACSHCVVACIHIAAIREEYPHEKFFYTVRYVSYDYEPIYANGTMLGINDPEGLIRVLEEIEIQGLDAMSTGVVLAWATEAYRRGLISKKDTLIDLRWGDWKSYIQAIRYIVKQPNEFYKTLALGVEEAAKKYGGLEFALSFGKNEMPGYHTGPGCHIGWLIGARHSHLDNAGYSLDQKFLSGNLPSPEEYVDLLMKEEVWRQILTSLVVCLFARGIYKPDIVAEAFNAIGYDYKVDDLLNIGWKIYKEKHKLKLELGFDPLKLRIPRRILEVPTPHGKIPEEYLRKAITYFSQKLRKILES